MHGEPPPAPQPLGHRPDHPEGVHVHHQVQPADVDEAGRRQAATTPRPQVLAVDRRRAGEHRRSQPRRYVSTDTAHPPGGHDPDHEPAQVGDDQDRGDDRRRRGEERLAGQFAAVEGGQSAGVAGLGRGQFGVGDRTSRGVGGGRSAARARASGRAGRPRPPPRPGSGRTPGRGPAPSRRRWTSPACRKATAGRRGCRGERRRPGVGGREPRPAGGGGDPAQHVGRGRADGGRQRGLGGSASIDWHY